MCWWRDLNPWPPRYQRGATNQLSYTNKKYGSSFQNYQLKVESYINTCCMLPARLKFLVCPCSEDSNLLSPVTAADQPQPCALLRCLFAFQGFGTVCFKCDSALQGDLRFLTIPLLQFSPPTVSFWLAVNQVTNLLNDCVLVFMAKPTCCDEYCCFNHNCYI